MLENKATPRRDSIYVFIFVKRKKQKAIYKLVADKNKKIVQTLTELRNRILRTENTRLATIVVPLKIDKVASFPKIDKRTALKINLTERPNYRLEIKFSLFPSNC